MLAPAVMDPFKDRVAVITGGAGGIGMALARAFAERGAAIVLADLDEAALAKSVAELTSGGAKAFGVATDVTKLESVQALAAATQRQFGGVHIVCNNAGIGVFGDMHRATHRDWQYTMNVNFWGVVHGIEAFVPLLLEQGQGGHIVNTASMAGLRPGPDLGAYTVTKYGVVGLTESLAIELGPSNIRVNAILPGVVEGERMDRVISARAEALGLTFDAMKEEYLRKISLRRMVTADDIAALALFLASPAGRNISGQAISVDGNLEYL